MAGIKMEIGATGQTVAENVKRVREAQGLTYTELSRGMNLSGRPVSPLGIRRIEEGGRRVDVDDLMALAVTLGVSAATFLLPDAEDENTPIAITGLETPVTSLQLWKWLRMDFDLPSAEASIDWFARALPRWRRRDVSEGLLELAALKRAQTGEASALQPEKPDHGND